MGFWTQKPTTSEFHKNFTGCSPTSPPSYSVGIFQISQPPFPPEIHKGGWGRWIFGPKNRPPQNFSKILLDVLPHLPHHIQLEFFKYLNPPSPQKFPKGGGVDGFLDPKTDHLRISPKFYSTFLHISPIIISWNFSNISTPLPPRNSQRGVGYVKKMNKN